MTSTENRIHLGFLFFPAFLRNNEQNLSVVFGSRSCMLLCKDVNNALGSKRGGRFQYLSGKTVIQGHISCVVETNFPNPDCVRDSNAENKDTGDLHMPKSDFPSRPDEETFLYSLMACRPAGRWKRALKLFHMMDEFSVKRTLQIYHACMEVLSDCGRWRRFLKLFRRMRVEDGLLPEKYTFALLMKSLIHSGQSKLVWNQLELMHKQNIDTDHDIFYHALLGCQYAKDPSTALKIFKMILSSSLKPQERHYFCCLKTCCSLEDTSKDIYLSHKNEIEHLYEEFMTAYRPLPINKENIELLIEINVLRGDGNEIFSQYLFTMRKNIDISFKLYNTIVNFLLREKQTFRAIKVYEDAKFRNISLEKETYENLLRNCGLNMGWKFSLEIVNLLYTENCVPLTRENLVDFEIAVSACSRAGRYKEALELLKRWRKRSKIEPNEILLTECIIVCCKKNKTADALELLDFMHKKKKMTPSVRAYSACILALNRRDRYHKSIKILEEMKSLGINISVSLYQSCIVTCERNLDTHLAEQIYFEMLHALSTRKGEKLDEAFFCIWILSCRPRLDRALELLSRCDEFLVNVSIHTYNACLNVARACNQWQKGLELLFEARTRTLVPDRSSYQACILMCSEAEEWDHVVDLLDEMRMDQIQVDDVSLRLGQRAGEKSGRLHDFMGIKTELVRRIQLASHTPMIMRPSYNLKS